MSFIHKIYLHRIIYALFSCVFAIYSLESVAGTYSWSSGDYTNASGNTISGDPAVEGSGVVLGTFNNNGIVSSSTSTGYGFWFYTLGTSTQRIVNAGSIDGGRYGIKYESGTSLFSLVNTGTISSSINNTTSVAVSTNGTITSIENSGSIIGVSKGIGNTNGYISSINNSGTISASGITGDAIYIKGLGSIGSITNTGSLVGTHASINNDGGALGTITNSGTITASGGDGAAILNTGILTSLTNSGTISGPVAIASVNSIGTITNSGTIDGDINISGQDVTILGGSSGTIGTLSGGTINLSSGNQLNFGTGNQLVNDVIGTVGGVSINAGSGGTVTFGVDNSYTGLTTISSGSLQVGAGGTTGSLGAGAIVNNAALAFNRSDTITLGNTISGTGSLSQLGSGSLILTADNSYSGNTTISSGTLQVGTGSTIGSLGAGAVVDNAALAFNRSDNITIGNTISGTGSLSQLGSGRLILNAANTYTGPTTVEAGNLQIGDSSHTSASITSPVTVDAGSTLSGFGTITGDVTNKGNVNPGESGQVGTLAVTGNYTQTSTSTLSVDVNSTTASKLNITGAASVAGTVDATVASGIPVNGSTRWTILSASKGVTGTYSNLTTNLPNLALVSFALGYDANDVYLGYKANYTSAATNQNQLAVASGLQTAFYSSPSTAGQSVLDKINPLSTSQAQVAFNALSGEGLSAQQTANFSATNLVVDASRRQANYWLMDECQTGASSKKNKAASHNALPTTCASNDNRQFRSWMTGVGASNSLEGSSSVGSASVSTQTGGGVVGFDYEVSSHLLVGGMVGGTASNYNVSARSSTGTDSSGQVGLYSVAKWNNFYVNSIFNYGYFSGDTKRYVNGLASTAEQTGKTSSNAFTGRAEVGYRMDHPLVNVMPFVAMQATSLQMNSFNESNTNNLGLAVAGNTTMSEPGSLGVQLDHSFDISDKWTLYPLLRMAWVHEFQTDRSVNASLQALPTSNWTVNGASAASNAANIGITVQAMSKHGVAVFASGNTETSSSTQSYMGELGVKWLF